jgi:hypothetical protein
MKQLLAAIAVVTSLVMAIPQFVGHQGQTPPTSAMDTSNWRIELVEAFGGSTPPDIALDSNNTPHVAYSPPGLVQHAVKTPGGWTQEIVATSPWGGAFTYFALGPSDEPHLLYSGYPGVNGGMNGVYYAVKQGGNWTYLSRPCGGADIVVDSLGSPHIACWGRTADGFLYALRYHILAGTTWTTEYIDTWTALSGSAWISLKLDKSQNPHVLYYNAVAGQVRYASRQKNGTWSVELVETIGNIQYIGRHGSLAIDNNGYIHAAYAAFVKWEENRATLRHAVRTSSGWSIETVVGPPGLQGMFTSLDLDKRGEPGIAYIYFENAPWGGKNKGLYYATRSNDGNWTTELVGIPDAWFVDSKMDLCGNPHIATYGDPGPMGWGVYYATKGNCTSNRSPIANAGGPYTGFEGSPLTFAASAADPDNDSLQFRWDFDNDGTADTSWSASPTATNIWSDDYTGEVRVEVSDGNLTSNATAKVTILNLPPKIGSVRASITATATLRIAGEKWHDVSAYIDDGGNETFIANLVREPGKPQETSFEIGIDVTRNNSIRIAYTPDDDKVNGQPNGATPAWLNITFDSGPPVELHHTFNVKHPNTWNWTVGLNSMLAGRDIAFTATATDPGSDDLTFTWEWGDGTPATATTYFNDGIGPDPYPSPDGMFPFTAADEQTHHFAVAGTFAITLTVTDDDGGSVTNTFSIFVD